MLRVCAVTEISGARVVTVGMGEWRNREGRPDDGVNRGGECYILGAEERHALL